MVKDQGAPDAPAGAGKIKEEDKEELKVKSEKLKSELKGDNLEEIKKATEELSKVAQRVGAELYKAGAEPQPTPPNPEQEIPKEDPHTEEKK